MRVIPTVDWRVENDADRDPLEPWIGEPPGVSTGNSVTSSALPLGQALRRDGLLTEDDITRILSLQERKGLRFGEAAVRLRLITPADLKRVLAEQFLHPNIEPGGDDLSRELMAMFKPASRQVESLRQQRSVLTQYWFVANPALAIVGPGHGEGRSYLAANLAVLVAQLGRRTLLIDGDMRRPRQHEFFGLENRIGLSQVLAGRARADQATRMVPAIKTLGVLSAGPVPPNPLELLDRGALPTVLRDLARKFPTIIVDTPAAARYGDARVLANGCRGVLMLLRRHHTRVREAKQLAATLLRTQVKLVGTVLNRF